MDASAAIIWLVGVAGSGKSTIGSRLARKLQRPFIDLDRRIQTVAGMTPAALFAAEGEAGFRQREQEALRWVIDQPLPLPVVACGAGVVERPDHGRLMTGSGVVLWLDLPLDVAMQRCRRRPETRPLMQDEAAYAQRLQGRVPLYRSMGLQVDATGSIKEVVRCALAELNSGSE
jgi:shikimate kinase